MNIQEFLTYSINTFVLSSILFFLLDFCFYLVNSWQQLNSSAQPSFYASCSSTESGGADTWGDPKCLNAPSKTALAYQQVKDLIWDLDSDNSTHCTLLKVSEGF